MDYNALTTYLENLLQDQTPSADFTQILPGAIQDAESRIYRECDFLATRTVDTSTSFTPNSRTLNLPSTILLFQGIAAITPSATLPALGTRNQLEITSIDFIDYTWPTAATTGVPEYVAPLNVSSGGVMTVVVAPTPDQAYVAEITGIFRPTPISASNLTTYLSLTYPDLLVNACMSFMSGWQRDFGAQGAVAQGQMATSWENKYQDSKKSVFEEEQRRKGSSTGWSQFQSTPLATPPRS